MALHRQCSSSISAMKFVIASCLLVACAIAAPQGDDRDRLAQITRDDRVDNGDGTFSYSFASDNGLEMEVAGEQGSQGQSNMRGFYLLPLVDGGFARVEFVADENGFRPLSDILPTPHPLPAHAQEQIRIAEEQRAQGITFE